MKEIYVEWCGPYSYNQIIENEESNWPVKPSDSGLYQIYGFHPVYGSNVLNYIGKTEKPFFERLKGRSIIIDNQDSNKVEIYLGRIFYDDTEHHNELSHDISRAESLLIHYHTPALNSSNINSLKYADENISIINIGDFRALNKQISTQSFTKELKLYEKINLIANKLDYSKPYKSEIEYGYWLNEDETLWFGVNYDLWNSDISLIVESSVNIKGFDADFSVEDETWYWKSLYGETIDGIVNELKKLVRK